MCPQVTFLVTVSPLPNDRSSLKQPVCYLKQYVVVFTFCNTFNMYMIEENVYRNSKICIDIFDYIYHPSL